MKITSLVAFIVLVSVLWGTFLCDIKKTKHNSLSDRGEERISEDTDRGRVRAGQGQNEG